MPSKLSAKLIALIVLILALAGSTGYWWLTSGRYVETTDNAYIRADKTIISSKLPGFLEAGWIKDNQRVKPGTLLAKIEADDYQTSLEMAESKTKATLADIASVRAQINLQDSLIHEAEAAISADEASLAQARDDVRRYTRLARSGYSAERERESAVVAREAALARLEQARATLDSSKKQKAVLNARLQQAIANRDASNASLDKARADMEKVMIKSPEAGVIAQRLAQNGEYVGSGTPLFSLVDLNTVWIVANFKETQIDHMKPGQPVEIDVDSFSGMPLVGYIDSIAPGSGAEFSILPPQNATGNFTKIVQRIPVKIMIPEGQALAGKLRPGMSALVRVDTLDAAVDLSRFNTANNNQLPEKPQSLAMSGKDHG
ncbi:HlyD family secretion protein [Endozoicomonas sp. Mp262]|uniref:HlyD family secretion protein n=1 Tax=Endozoicomonas sp. Mp262 TaxID=2919499 RepID=UPI0021D949E9